MDTPDYDAVWDLYSAGKFSQLASAVRSLPTATRARDEAELALLQAVSAGFSGQVENVVGDIEALFDKARRNASIDAMMTAVASLHAAQFFSGVGDEVRALTEISVADMAVSEWLEERGGKITSTGEAVVMGSLQIAWMLLGAEADATKAYAVARRLAKGLSREENLMGLQFGPRTLAATLVEADVNQGIARPESLQPFLDDVTLSVPHRMHLALSGARAAEERGNVALCERLAAAAQQLVEEQAARA